MAAIEERGDRTVRSALWAAWGDALGFITELADEKGVAYRTRGIAHVEQTVPWRRKIGGKFGSSITLPAGIYSDDTQLRLATSRSIRGDGSFDVFAFAKMELPLWPLYELGGGRASKAAADSLSQRDRNWNANFFKGYEASGGNGAAMRIQPHVWSATDPANQALIYPAIIRNAVCTHGHPRGILGAVLHGASLGCALKHGRLSVEMLYEIIDSLEDVPRVVATDRDLGRVWLPYWEKNSGQSFETACRDVFAEARRSLESLESIDQRPAKDLYEAAVQKLNLRDPGHRGSGILTALAASWLAIRIPDPLTAITLAANSLQTDTDSIATMVGAIAGCWAAEGPKGDLLDRAYLASEATRLVAVAEGAGAASFQHPPLPSFKMPKRRADAVRKVGAQRVHIVGLGDGVIQEPNRDEARIRVLLDFGQTLMIVPPSGNGDALPEATSLSPKVEKITPPKQAEDLFSANGKNNQKQTLNEQTDQIIRNGFDEREIGRLIIDCTKSHGDDDAIMRASAAAAIIAKAIIARRERNR